jgi:hypothetical protein
MEPSWELDPLVTMQLKTKKLDIPVLVIVGKNDSSSVKNSSAVKDRN